VLDAGNFLNSILRGLNNSKLFKPLMAYLYRDMHSHTRAAAGAGDARVSSGHDSLSSSAPAADHSGAEERALQERAPLDCGASMRERLTTAPLTAAATTRSQNFASTTGEDLPPTPHAAAESTLATEVGAQNEGELNTDINVYFKKEVIKCYSVLI
jgi:hypothetical protein